MIVLAQFEAGPRQPVHMEERMLAGCPREEDHPPLEDSFRQSTSSTAGYGSVPEANVDNDLDRNLKIRRKQVRDWMSKHKLRIPQQGTAKRLREYCRRLRFVLSRLKRRALATPWEEFRQRERTEDDPVRPPMTLARWHFLRQLDVEKAIQLYAAAVSEKAMFVLGRPLTCEELLSLLPDEKVNNRFWGVYVDILTGKTICDMIPYVGSGTDKNQGLVACLGGYLNTKADPRKDKERSAHTIHVFDETVKEAAEHGNNVLNASNNTGTVSDVLP